MVLTVKDGMFAEEKQYEFYDEEGTIKYSAKGEFPSEGEGVTVYNEFDEFIGEITRKLVNFRSTFYLEVPKYGILTIGKEFTYYEKHLAVEGIPLSIEGDFTLYDFTVVADEETVMTVTSGMKGGVSYVKLFIEDEHYADVLVNLFVVVDLVNRDGDQYVRMEDIYYNG